MANSAQVGLLRVLLTADTAEFQAAMKAAAGSAQAWTKDLRSIGNQAQAIGSALTKTLSLPILAIGGASLQAAIQFESSFAGVKKTVNATEAEFAQMAQGFRDLAKTIPINVNELNKIGEAAGQLGIGKKDILEFSSVMAQLGVTTNLTSDAAATAIAQIQNIFNASGKDTKNFASALVALGNAGASTEAQIVDFASRLAGAGHQIGLSQQTVLGFSSALANMGLNAELGGTAMSKTMSLMSVAVDTGGKKLEGFARVVKMSGEDFKALFKRDAGEAILQFVEGLGKASQSGENLTIILRDLGLKGSNVQDVLKRLSGGVGQMREAVELSKKSWTENTALTIEAQKRFETTASQLTLLGNRFRDVGITIGNALLPMVKAIVAGFNVLLPVIETVAKMFAAMPVSLQIIVTAFALLVAAAGPAVFIFGQLVTSAAAVTAAFTKKGIATRALSVDLEGMQTQSSLTGSALGVLGKAAAVAGALFVGWEIGKLISDLAGLETQATRTAKRLEELAAARAKGGGVDTTRDVITAQIAELRNQANRPPMQQGLSGEDLAALQVRVQSLRAQLDTLNKAIAQGASVNITYADAVQYNAHIEGVRAGTLDKSVEAQKRSIESLLALGKITQQQANDQLAALSMDKQVNDVKGKRLSLNEFLAKSEQNIKDKIDATGYSVAQLVARLKDPGFAEWAKLVGLDADALHFLESQAKASTKAIAEATGSFNKFQKSAKELEKELQAAAKAGVPMSIILDEYKSKLEDVTHKAPIFGVAIGEATRKAAEALNALNLGKILDKASKELNTDARQMVAEWQKMGEAAGKRLTEQQKESNKAFITNGRELQKGLLALEDDSLQKRLELIRIEYEAKREAVNRNTPFFADQLRLIDTQEAMAAEAATASWQKHVDDVRAAVKTYPSIFQHALAGIPGLIQAALTGGGGFAGAGKSILSGLGSELGGHLFTDLTRHLSNTFSKVGVGFTKFMGDVLPGIGAALGSLVGPLIEKIISAFGTAGRDAKLQLSKEMFGSVESLQKQLVGLGQAEYDRLWKKFSQIGQNNKEQAQAVMAEIQAALAKSPAAMASSGGYKTIKELQDIADQAKKTYEYMRTSGLYTAGAIADAYTKLKDAQLAAMDDVSRATEEAMTKGVAAIKETMGSAEVKALAEGFKRAQAEGFKGSEEEFLRQQLEFYQTIKEGDARLKTWFSGTTIAAFKLIEAGQGELAAKILGDIKKIDDEIKGLTESIAGEAPEEFMGVVERQTRDRIDALGAQRKKLEDELQQQQQETQDAVGDTAAGVDGVTDAAGHTLDMFTRWKDAINDVGDALRRLPRMPGSGEVPEPATGLAQGGVVRYLASGGPSWRPRGTDTVPAMLTPGEGVVTRAGMSSLGVAGLTDINSGRWLDGLKSDLYSRVPAFEPTGGVATWSSTTILEVDKRELGRAIADVLPGELRRLGVRVRA